MGLLSTGNRGRDVFIWTWVVIGLLEIVKGELLNLENALKQFGLVTNSCAACGTGSDQ